MFCWRRCLVLVPVLSFLAAALWLSGGGNSSGAPIPAAIRTSLSSVVICTGSPPAPMPSPTPTKKHKPTPTPTPACIPVSATSPVGVGDTMQLNAQGTFVRSNVKNPKKFIFRDITNAASSGWWDQPANIVKYNGNGQYLAITPGCTCVQVTVAGILSQSVSVTVGTPCPACT